ncbi:hypothetical protein HanRHA438_Chr09g0396421 [Helianthus annuus]|nr:hypothetical protein HanHA300_Chr09g0315861 [Helianthus annuus]KAJ0534024.1 hypothetical protein HanIR_Chr09g0415081 [Helianthus annuus]KAJ0542164.1 hypothetical protein HanHA89_Chr09g0336781 [Helianthus annuus]KAJ0707222.1 hypothetical protein HanLR1_Chr09g0316091 [Helianthus annuus]KAJ0887930.1 hypothetical protein HanRHA438_Chr09g0396421 [Helianthus annuus]
MYQNSESLSMLTSHRHLDFLCMAGTHIVKKETFDMTPYYVSGPAQVMTSAVERTGLRAMTAW